MAQVIDGKALAKKIRELELIGCNIFSCSIINTEKEKV